VTSEGDHYVHNDIKGEIIKRFDYTPFGERWLLDQGLGGIGVNRKIAF
jgi:hypothetical protein